MIFPVVELWIGTPVDASKPMAAKMFVRFPLH